MEVDNSATAFTKKEVELQNLKSELQNTMKNYQTPILGIVAGKDPNMDLVEKAGAIVKEVSMN